MTPVNTFVSSKFQEFHAKTTGSHVALRERNSGAKSGGELLKCSKNLASLVVRNEEKIFWLGVAHFL